MNIFLNKAKKLMRYQTIINGAPVWDLTKTAVAKGRKLAKLYNVDSEIVELSLWLAHISFSDKVGDAVQKNHTKLSAELAEKYLLEWGYPRGKARVVYNSILEHHNEGPGSTMIAEVMKNAECYKFITWPKLKLYYNDLLRRGYSFDDAGRLVRLKFNQKMSVLTFPECITDASAGYLVIDRELKALASNR